MTGILTAKMKEKLKEQARSAGVMTCWSNPCDEYKNTREKSSAWLDAYYNGGMALDANGKWHPVKNFSMDRLAFVAGLWRVQCDFPYKIVNVRGIDMVLMGKINRVENTLFDFWNAKQVGYNCYGPFISKSEKPDYIVAKYITTKGTYMAYGRTVEEARAYLGIKLYDEYKHVIHAIENGQTNLGK